MMRLYSIFLSGALLIGANSFALAQDKYQEKTKVDDSKPGQYKEKTKIKEKDESGSYKEKTKVNEKKGKLDSTVQENGDDGTYKTKVKSRTKHGETTTKVDTKEKP